MYRSKRFRNGQISIAGELATIEEYLITSALSDAQKAHLESSPAWMLIEEPTREPSPRATSEEEAPEPVKQAEAEEEKPKPKRRGRPRKKAGE